ncbi:Sec-independent protein translocase protein TatB [Methylocaldum marinum]|uniref:Sec-independent protein translocase protein TatB n=1 Tax=Methylocaldum marinum TaxID=1432792 RepID=A0A286P490_9GAMM|nr:Sec-independent protein translocase protein TatB [Methylocaldum marinum]BBA32462.1 Sec-independent protein translocase protein TatB [Methylocaldum marinum]
MFEIGFWEMVLVGAVGLLVLGPERLPRVARETAQWVRKTKSVMGSLRRTLIANWNSKRSGFIEHERRQAYRSPGRDAGIPYYAGER